MQGYEEFSENQIKILEHYVTDTSSNVFALRNLPEVIKGALFSRYSRSSLGLRSLLLKEFISNEETAFEEIVGQRGDDSNDQVAAIKRAQNFYDRILDGFGDDSIGELGGAHLAIENVSMIAAKVIEDCRIGGSPLEKSTRYVYFDQKVNGEYQYYREPILMASAFRDIYIKTCNHLFETYSKLITPLTEHIKQSFPKEEGISKAAYTAALRAKVLDCLRGLLPASTFTNMGIFGNGRFFETLIRKLHSHNLAELQEVGKGAYDQLSCVIPSFVRRAEISHRYYESHANFHESMDISLNQVAQRCADFPQNPPKAGVKLIDCDVDAPVKVAAALLFGKTHRGLQHLQQHCRQLSETDLEEIFDASCKHRTNRRHKSPRALEHASFTFEIIGDFGIYRDLQRHRLLTQDRQLVSCHYGFSVPVELIGTDMEEPYCEALEKAKEVYDTIASELPEEAQYIVPMAYNLRWYFTVNLRALQWMCELRSMPQGHPHYRYVAQEMARLVCKEFPVFERFLTFVDYEGYELGRLPQEQRSAVKKGLV
jgi:thymidylate synthase ThyX